MKIQFRTTSHLTTRRNIPEPTPPPQELRSKIAFGKNKTYFCQDKTPIMLKAGRTQTLTVNRISDYGLYLIDDEQNEVLLPNRYVSLANKVGDTLEVFVYHDSEDRLVATTETPKPARRRSGIPARSGQEPARRIPRLGTRGQRPVPAQPQPAGRRVGRTELPGLPVCRFGNGALRGDHEIQKLRQ